MSAMASVYLLFSCSQSFEAASIFGPNRFCRIPGANEAAKKIKDKYQEAAIPAAKAATNCKPLKTISSSASTRWLSTCFKSLVINDRSSLGSAFSEYNRYLLARRLISRLTSLMISAFKIW